jgi:hypothetical protein
MDVVKAIDSLTCEMRDSRAQFLKLRLGGFLEGGTDSIEAVHLSLICTVD